MMKELYEEAMTKQFLVGMESSMSIVTYDESTMERYMSRRDNKLWTK